MRARLSSMYLFLLHIRIFVLSSQKLKIYRQIQFFKNSTINVSILNISYQERTILNSLCLIFIIYMKTDFILYIFTLLEFTDSFIFVKSLFISPCSATNISSLAVFGSTITLYIYIQLRLITNYSSLAVYFVNKIQ